MIAAKHELASARYVASLVGRSPSFLIAFNVTSLVRRG